MAIAPVNANVTLPKDLTEMEAQAETVIDTSPLEPVEPVESADTLTMGDPLAVEGFPPLPATQPASIHISFSEPSKFQNRSTSIIDDRDIPQEQMNLEHEHIVDQNKDDPNTFIVNGYRVSENTFNLYLEQRQNYNDVGDLGEKEEPIDLGEGYEVVQQEEIIPDDFRPVTQPQQIPDINIDLPENVDVKNQVDKNLSDLEELANLRFSQEQLAEWRETPISAGEAPDFMGYEDWVPGGGVYQGAQAIKLLGIVEDLQEGKPISEADQAKLDNWLDKHVEISVRGFDWGGGIVYHGAGIPAVMLEFAASGGLGKTVQVGFTKALTKTATEVAIASATKAAKVKAAAVTATGLTARVATQSALTPGIYVDEYGDRRLKDRLNITSDGEVIYKLSTESPVKAALMAYTYTNVEIVSELAGGRLIKGFKYIGNKSGVNDYVIDPVTMRVKSVATTSLDKLPDNVKVALFKAYKRIKPNARMSEVFTKAGWHGLLAEFSEEQLAKILSSAVGYTFEEGYTIEDVLENSLSVLDPEQFGLEMGLLVLTKGGITTVNGIRGSYQYQKDQAAQKAFEELPVEDQMRMLTAMLNVQAAPPRQGFAPTPFLPQQPVDTAPPAKDLITDEIIEQSDSYVMPLDQVAKEGDAAQSPWLTSSGKIIGSSGDHLAVSGNISEALGLDNTGEYAGFMQQTGAIRFSAFKEKTAKSGDRPSKDDPFVVTLHLSEGQKLTPEQIDALEYINKENNGDVTVLHGATNSDKNPQYKQSKLSDYLEEAKLENDIIADEAAPGIVAYHATTADPFFEFNPDAPRSQHSFAGPEGIYFSASETETPIVFGASTVKAKIDIRNPAKVEVMPKGPDNILPTDYVVVRVDVTKLPKDSNTYNDLAYISENGSFERVNSDEMSKSEIKKLMKNKNLFYTINPERLFPEDIKILKEAGYDGIVVEGRGDTSNVPNQIVALSADQVNVISFNGVLNTDNLNEFEATQIDADKFDSMADYTDELNLKFTPVANPPGATLDGAPLPDDPKPVIDYTESMWANLKKNLIDDFEPVLRMLKVAEARGLTVEDGANPKLLAKTFYGIVGKIEENLSDNTFYFDEKGNKVVTGLGLGKILEDFDVAMLIAEKSQKQRRLDLSTYLISKRIVEDLVDMDGVTITDKQLADARLDLANLELKYGDKFEIFDLQAQEIYGFQRRIMENLVRSGNMSKKDYDDLIKANPNYIPFKRVMDEKGYTESGIGGQFDNASSKSLFRKFRGSEREIKDPIQSIISNTVRTISIADRNAVAKSVIALAEFMPEYITRSKGKTIIHQDKKTGAKVYEKEPGENDIVVYVNGKRQFWNVPPGVKDAMQGLDPVMLGTATRILSSTVRVARTGITAVPSFVIKNIFRDQFVTSIQSGTFKTPIDTVAGLLSIMNITDGQLYKDWKASGAAQSFYMDISDTGLADAAKEMYNPDSAYLKILKSPIKSYLNAVSVAENATRVGAYRAAKRQGMSDLAAGNAAREASVDFATGGKWSKNLNRHLMFLNVGIQGAARFVQTFKRNPKMATLIATTTITMPSVMLALYYLYEAPEDERQEYLEIPEIQRANNWAYKSDGQWHLIPKPFTYGYIFGTMPELFLLDMYDGKKPEGRELWKELSSGLPKSVSPIQDYSGLFPSYLKAIVEPLTGFDFWQDRRVSTDWMEKLDPEFRATRGTSETAKFLGEELGLSPIGIEQFTKNVLGTTSQYLTGAGDKILSQVREMNGELQNAKPESNRRNLITKGFLLNDPISLNSITVSTFFDLSLEVERKLNSYNKLPEHKQDEYEKNNEFIFNNEYIITDAMKDVRDLLSDRNEILDDYSLSAESKRRQIEPIERDIHNIAFGANNQWTKSLNRYLDKQ